MTDEARLRRAAERVFLCGLDDAAEQLCRANMTFGLAKIHVAEEELGLEPRACFVGAPDATVTRNIHRWRHGFGYGGQVCWDERLAVLDSKPNGCGMLVGTPAAAPDGRAVREAAAALRQRTLTLDGVELAYDLDESNHFVDGLELEEVLDPDLELPRDLFIVHSSGHEHRPRSPWGPGLYVDESAELRAQATRIQTPWGPLSVLVDEAAERYHAFCRQVQDFNRRRRALLGELLFGPHRTLVNATHQGFRGPGRLLLGAYGCDDPGAIYPLTLGPDQPVFLVRPRPSFSAEAVARLGWRGRAERLGLLEQLTRVDLLPHGGGYAFPSLRGLARVETQGEQRTFWLEALEGPPLAIRDARELPFAYRGLEVLRRLEELGLGEAVARYRIRFVIRA